MKHMVWFRTWARLALVLFAGNCAHGVRPDAVAPPLPHSSAPISLVTTDGVQLELLAVRAEALLAEPMAFTELHLRFRNPEARILEGRFRIVLPPSARVARFAMKVQGKLEEAELVELSQAHEAYEMFLHARQDPALLEQGAGNEFSARIFPIAPKEEKEIVIGYSEELVDAETPYRIALAGLSVAGEIAVTVREAGSQGVQQRTLKFSAAQDFVKPLSAGERIVRSGPWVVGRVKIPGATTPAPLHSLAVLFDTSASRAQIVDLEEQLDQAHTDAEGHLVSRLLDLSMSERVMCRLTGFVVLENDAAWLRTAAVVKPSKILSLDASGLHVSHHTRDTGCCWPSPPSAAAANLASPIVLIAWASMIHGIGKYEATTAAGWRAPGPADRPWRAGHRGRTSRGWGAGCCTRRVARGDRTNDSAARDPGSGTFHPRPCPQAHPAWAR